jgi:nucleotide-binding universal stress UspA family protein
MPMELKSLLVTTDLSEASECALDAAGELARRLGARVTLLFVLDFDPALPPGVIALSPDREAAFKRDVRSKVQARLGELAGRHMSELEHELVIEEGSGAARTICDYAKRHAPDLLILSTHGRSGLKRMLIGSVAERVVRLAPCPVLTLRPA